MNALRHAKRVSLRDQSRGLHAFAAVGERIGTHVMVTHSNSCGNRVNAEGSFGNPDGSPNFNNIFYHDQLLLLRSSTTSVGLEYRLNPTCQVSFDLGRTSSAANAHIYDYDASFGISISF